MSDMTPWLIFPQYLWRIGVRRPPIAVVGLDVEQEDGIAVFIRRGNNCNEPMEKFERKDRHRLTASWQVFQFGILPYCRITDAEDYSITHKWDWLNG